MKKILVNLLAISGLAVTMVACSSGSSGNSSVAPAAAPVVNPVTPPSSGIPIYNGTPTYYNSTDGTYSIIVPQPVAGGVAYQSVTLAASSAATALVAALGSGSVVSSAVLGNMQTFNTESVSYTVNLASTPTAMVSVAPVSNVTTPVYAITEQTDATAIDAVFYGTNTPNPALVLSPFMVGTQSTQALKSVDKTVELSGCVANPGTPQALAASVVASNWYIGVGTSSGNVCIYNVNNSGSVITSPWSNLTPQGVNHGYTPSAISNFTFTNLGSGTSPLVGYWQNTNGQIWRVTASIGSTIAPTSFWQVNSPNTQTSTAEVNKGQSVTFTNVVPAARVSSIYSDPANNLYVGTKDGYVYKLAAGSTNWSAPVQIGGSTTPVYVSKSGLASGAIATSTLAGGIVTASVQ